MATKKILSTLDYQKIEKDISGDNLTKYKEEKNIILKKTVAFYVTIGIMTLLFILIDIAIFLGLKNLSFLSLVIKIGYNILFGIYIIIMLIYLPIRFFVFGDMERLKGFFIIKGDNFIGANFFLSQKRLFKKYYPLNDDGKTFSAGEKDYILDNSCIWLDSHNIPNAFYVPNIPNPINFDFFNYLTKYFTRLESGEDAKNIKENLDIRYSAENLRILKNDKLMKELHRDKSEDLNKMVKYMVIICCVFAFVVVLLALFLGGKQPQVIIQNVTSATVK